LQYGYVLDIGVTTNNTFYFQWWCTFLRIPMP